MHRCLPFRCNNFIFIVHWRSHFYLFHFFIRLFALNRNLCRSICEISIDFRCCLDAVTAKYDKTKNCFFSFDFFVFYLNEIRSKSEKNDANIKINNENGKQRFSVSFFLVEFDPKVNTRSLRSSFSLFCWTKAEERSILN